MGAAKQAHVGVSGDWVTSSTHQAASRTSLRQWSLTGPSKTVRLHTFPSVPPATGSSDGLGLSVQCCRRAPWRFTSPVGAQRKRSPSRMVTPFGPRRVPCGCRGARAITDRHPGRLSLQARPIQTGPGYVLLRPDDTGSQHLRCPRAGAALNPGGVCPLLGFAAIKHGLEALGPLPGLAPTQTSPSVCWTTSRIPSNARNRSC